MSYKSVKEGRSSIFKIDVAQGSKAYRYDVSVECKTNWKDIPLSKQSNEHLKNVQNLWCRRIVKYIFDQTDGFGRGIDQLAYCYDGKTMLYANMPFKDQNFNLKSSDLSSNNLEYSIKSDSIIVTISSNVAAPEIEYSSFDSSLIKGKNFAVDHTVRAFYELVSSEYPIASGQFQHLQAGTIFRTQPIANLPGNIKSKLKPGMSVFDGMQKGVRIVDEKTALMVLDLRRSIEFGAFDQQGNPLSLAEIYQQFVFKYKNDYNRVKAEFIKFFKGVKMLISYDTSRTLDFHTLSSVPINHSSFNVEGKSLPQFYKEQHRVNLKHVNMVGAQSFDNLKKGYVYPLEVLYVLPGQFVSQEKHDIPLENSVKAQERYNFIMEQAKFLASGECAKYLAKFGIRILDSSNKVQINSISLPKIRFKGHNSPNKTSGTKIMEKQIVPKENGSFFNDAQYSAVLVDRKLLKKWFLLYEEDNVSASEISNFVDKLIDVAKKAEFNFPIPTLVEGIKLDNLESYFMKEKEERPQLIIYVGNENHSHGRLKLFEANHKILTQQLDPKNLDSGNQTMKNFILKLNSKCFGLNFMPVFTQSLKDYDLEKNPNLMVLGYDVSHPTHANFGEMCKMRQANIDLNSFQPSVVGIAANKNSHLGSFSADYFYQESCKEELNGNLLKKAIENVILCAYKTSKNTRKITRILILRDGVSEGQYDMVINKELPAIKAGYAEAMKSIGDQVLANKSPEITLAIGTKRHNKRFFHIDSNGAVSNTCPGDVVNSAVTRKDIVFEIFLQSHNAILGTAQTTQYDVLRDELKIGRQKLEELILALANMHQIAGCPTSLPLPIYLADEMATRGREVFNEFDFLLNRAEDKPDFVKNLVKPDFATTNEVMEYFDKLTQQFAYAGSKLYETRVN